MQQTYRGVNRGTWGGSGGFNVSMNERQSWGHAARMPWAMMGIMTRRFMSICDFAEGQQKTKSIQLNREHDPFEDLLVRTCFNPRGNIPSRNSSTDHNPTKNIFLSLKIGIQLLYFVGRGKEARECQFFFCENKLSLAISCVYKQKNNSSCFFLFSFVFVPGQSSQEKQPFQDHPPQDHPKFCSFPLTPQNFTLFFHCLVLWPGFWPSVLPTNACKNCPPPVSNSVMANFGQTRETDFGQIGFSSVLAQFAQPTKNKPQTCTP